MNDIRPTPVSRAIAQRVRGRRASSPMHAKDPATLAPQPELLEYLAGHLERGETHYTTRPGLVELRSRVAAAVASMGVPNPGVEGVVITAGEGEALCATLLSLDVVNGGRVRLVGHEGRHEPLLTMLGVEEAESHDPDLEELPRIVCLWRAVGTVDGRCPEGSRPDDLHVGSLDGLPGMPAFRLGFAAGPPDRVKKVMTWKQAWSICSPGPSQRAGLFAFDAAARGGVEGDGS